ncbi:2-dehydro-3-deoxygalactonokinase [Niabella aurantiaca]|uniref:2-dehydro-3-deoxygalactonokinase n=1 Tax=Niabella aurantiaca TaxID=379900 RepID=UPI00146DFE24|nr:2-dehydro-3-deoxygalactonokinase [Niabella aurantiaca]
MSCDWGTSTFRLRLVHTGNGAIQATLQQPHGIGQMIAAWQQQGGSVSRQEYGIAFLNRQIGELERQLGTSLGGVPVVLSGMASSSVGLMELPYKELPFSVDGTGLLLQPVPNGSNPLLMISGARTATDVMRGEETKIVGAAAGLPETGQELLLILPGTHPKHVRICNHQVIAFQTFMTGEFFGLLSENSILSASVKRGGDLTDPANHRAFTEAVQHSRRHAVLQHAFRVRTNQLLEGMLPEQNYHYLSGLLIGAELHALPDGCPVFLLGGGTHLRSYMLACEVLGIDAGALPDADAALVSGQQRLLLRYLTVQGGEKF